MKDREDKVQSEADKQGVDWTLMSPADRQTDGWMLFGSCRQAGAQPRVLGFVVDTDGIRFHWMLQESVQIESLTS